MLSQTAIPDTFNYMIAGYVVLILALGLYLLSLITRWRKSALQYRVYQRESRGETKDQDQP